MLAGTAAFCVLFWRVYGRIRPAGFVLFCLTWELLCAAYAALRWEALALERLGQCLLGLDPARLDPARLDGTEAILWGAAVLLPLLFLLEFFVHRHGVLLLLTAPLLLLGPFLGLRTGLGTVGALLLFQAGFWAVQTVYGRRRQTIADRQRLAGQSAAAMGLLLALAFLLAVPLSALWAESIYDSVYRTEGEVLQVLRRAGYIRPAGAATGYVSRGNNHRTGAEMLILQASRRPSGPIYLRGFAGGSYSQGSFSAAHDGELLDRMAERLEMEEWRNWMEVMYQDMYFMFNWTIPAPDTPAPAVLLVQNTGAERQVRYTPYYSSRLRIQTDEEEGPYAFEFFEQADMGIGAERAKDNAYGQWLTEIEGAYMEAAREFYTQVPQESLPRLTALCEANPQGSLEEITAFILYTLRANAAYTLTPGMAPLNTDVVEHFLFDRHLGYCVHFAAAATLLYRLYGVPARYAAGYVVYPEDFQEGPSSYDVVRLDYTAAVTDLSAHAWVEIYLEDYGWTPIEVTPSADGLPETAYPGASPEMIEQLMKDRGWDFRPGAWAMADRGQARWSPDLRLSRTAAAWALCLLPLAPMFRRWRGLRRLERMDCRERWSHLERLLRWSGYSAGDEETASSLAALGVSGGARLEEIVRSAAFGPAEPDPAAEAEAAAICQEAAGAVYRRLGWWRRKCFRYWKVFA